MQINSQINHTRKSFYERLGGETVVRKLVQHFYQYMDSLQETKSIRAMHASDLNNAEDKLFMFLSGWLGGPSLYIEKFGHPRLRQRHLPFEIDESARDQWILCMKHALDDSVSDPALRKELLQALYDVADFMRNRS